MTHLSSHTTAKALFQPYPNGGADARHEEAHGWHVRDIAFEQIDRARIEGNEDLFYLLMGASFIETGSDTYASNLAEHYREYPEIADWLRNRWEREELQHGAALRRYVETVWPGFPWQAAYDSFFAEYSRLCTVEELNEDRQLEMVARCVVETGTTAYYHTLRELSDEPVLRQLLGHIRSDEVGHFKYFLKYFKQLQQESPVGRGRIAGALYARLKELRESDSDVALRHVYAHKGWYFSDRNRSFAEVAQRAYQLISTQLPADLAVRMLLKPLLLPPRLEGYLYAPITRLATRVMAP
ncbi:ferritin-like domain-containing protein [Diaphorobacter ruginosibacter]|uniref:ferritin-like domain-containing protein n=1 Tax=Diaphorobacter ruginosibacter TaxID=1715720 RepID=UPI0033414D99